MRFWLLVSTMLLIASAVMYYVTYGRLHNDVEKRLNITYQTAPTEAPINTVHLAPDAPASSDDEPTAECRNLPNKQDVHLFYTKSTAKDCGSLNDNELVMDEAQSKEVLNCLKASLENGQCTKTKAFLALQGFEGMTEMFVESDNCELTVHQWSTTTPSCGYTKANCNEISERFPFAVCK